MPLLSVINSYLNLSTTVSEIQPLIASNIPLKIVALISQQAGLSQNDQKLDK